MKRPASPLSSGRERRRQDPVSCSLCRSKKLKCSRQQPCSNCVSRGLACDFAPASTDVSSSDNRAQVERSSRDHILADVLERLQRLERAVLDNNSSSLNTPNISSGYSQSTHDDRPFQAGKDIKDAGHTMDQLSEQAYTAAETVTTRDDAVTLSHADTISYGIKSISEMVTSANLARHAHQEGRIYEGISVHRQTWLPRQQDSLSLFDEYVNSTGAVYHMMHFPTTRQLIKDIYTRLELGQQINPAHLALLLAICSTGAYFWNPTYSVDKTMFQSTEQGEEASLIWRKWALDVLENNRRTMSGSIEDLQATILISHLIINLEGFSPRGRVFYAITSNMARDLGLHTIDSPRHRRNTAGPRDGHVMTEVKRRLWWYIASTDWLLSSIPGPQEGFYSVQPRQMCVNKPKNIDDDELTDDTEPQDHPMSHPTGMSYFLARCTPCEFARLMCDASPPLASDTRIIDPNNFIMLVAKNDECLTSLPAYYQLDKSDSPNVKAMHAAMPMLTMQRAIVNLAIYLGQMRLYRLYIFRKSLPPPYDRSRDACIQASRKVIAIRRSMEDVRSSLAFSPTRMTFIIHHVFMAILLLAVDLCYNDFPNETAKEERRKEVREACKILEHTRGFSPVASRYIAPLVDILRKHKISLRDSDQKVDGVGDVRSYANTVVQEEEHNGAIVPVDGADYSGGVGVGGFEGGDGAGADFVVWEDILDFPSTLQMTPNWDQLFADLDSTYTF